MLTQHLHPLHLTWKAPTWFTIGIYRVWHVALLGLPCSTLGLRWMRKANVSHRFSPYVSKCPVKGCRTMRLLSFPIGWSEIHGPQYFLGPSHPECYCGWDEMCLCWWNSLRWFKSRLAGILGSSTVPSNFFWLNMIMLNKGFRCRGFCSPILLLLPLLKQFNTPPYGPFKTLVISCKNYSPYVWWLNPCNLPIKFCWWTDIIPVWFSDIWYLAQYSDGHCLLYNSVLQWNHTINP